MTAENKPGSGNQVGCDLPICVAFDAWLADSRKVVVMIVMETIRKGVGKTIC